jgi:hypothetical protein
LYSCLTRRADALFELADAVLCADGPVRSLVELSLVGEHRRGHGGLYDALSSGRVDISRLRRALTTTPLPRASDGRLVLAADLTCWLRPSAHTSPQRILCHTYGRGKDQHIPVPGWPYSVICALETGRSSWTAPLDVLRLAPGDDAATVTAGQMRGLIERLMTAGQWKDGDPEILIVVDAGYDVPRLAFLLKDLPVQVLGRMRSGRVLRRAVPPREPGVRGRPPRHGGEFVFGDPATWNIPDAQTVTETRLYGTAVARSWDRLHPRLTHRSAWTAELGVLPVIEGTVIRLQVEHLPSGATPKPVWLWWSGTDATTADVDRLWQAFLRRFDIERCFNRLKQFRAIATRFDKLATRYKAGVRLAALILWLREPAQDLQEPSSRTPLGRAGSCWLASGSGLGQGPVAGGAGAGPAVQQVLEGVEDLVEGESGVSAFGDSSCSVRKAWAAVTRVT